MNYEIHSNGVLVAGAEQLGGAVRMARKYGTGTCVMDAYTGTMVYFVP